jgi:hypothetical protein
VLAGRLLAQVGSDLVRRHKLLVLVQDGTAKAALLDDDGGQDESGTDLDEANVRFLALASLGRSSGFLLFILLARLRLGRLHLVDLVVADPDLAVDKGKAHDAVDEGLGFPCALRDAKRVQEQLLDHPEVGLLLESIVEAEDGPRALEAVAGKVQLIHCVHWEKKKTVGLVSDCSRSALAFCVLAQLRGKEFGKRHTVLGVELYGRAVGDLAAPQVQILALSRFEKEAVVAVVQFGELVQLVELALGVELGILATMGHHVCQVAEEVAVSLARREEKVLENMELSSYTAVSLVRDVRTYIGYSARGENKNSLLVLLDAICWRLGLVAAGLGEGLVH